MPQGDTVELCPWQPASEGRLRAMAAQVKCARLDDEVFFDELICAAKLLDETDRERLIVLLERELSVK